MTNTRRSEGIVFPHANVFALTRLLQPENILLYAPGPYPRIQLADFGLARRRSHEETFNVCGTVSYLPPEGILALEYKDYSYIGMPADCWSAGVVMYIMISYVPLSLVLPVSACTSPRRADSPLVTRVADTTRSTMVAWTKSRKASSVRSIRGRKKHLKATSARTAVSRSALSTRR